MDSERPIQDPNPLYASPEPSRLPAVWTWNCVYYARMALLTLAVIGLGIFFQTLVGPEADDPERLVYGVMFVVMGVILMEAYIVAPFLPTTLVRRTTTLS